MIRDCEPGGVVIIPESAPATGVVIAPSLLVYRAVTCPGRRHIVLAAVTPALCQHGEAVRAARCTGCPRPQVSGQANKRIPHLSSHAYERACVPFRGSNFHYH